MGERPREIAPSGDWTANLHFVYDLMPLMGGGEDQLRALIQKLHPRVLILDTFTELVKTGSKAGSDVSRRIQRSPHPLYLLNLQQSPQRHWPIPVCSTGGRNSMKDLTGAFVCSPDRSNSFGRWPIGALSSLLISTMFLSVPMHAQESQLETITGTVNSLTRSTMLVKAEDGLFKLFSFDRNTTKPATIPLGSQVRVISYPSGDADGWP